MDPLQQELTAKQTGNIVSLTEAPFGPEILVEASRTHDKGLEYLL